MSIPIAVLLTSGNQRFTLLIDGVEYAFVLRWNNAPLGGWVLDIYRDASTPLVAGLPLVTGADMLAQHRHLGIPRQLILAMDGDLDATPRYDQIARDANLYLVPL